jgi:hypothetical protein
MDMSNLIMVNSSSMGGDGRRRCIGAFILGRFSHGVHARQCSTV